MTGASTDRGTKKRAGNSAADASVPKRKPGRPKGTPASEKQKATSAQARAASAAARKKRKQEREAALEVPRWKQLEDGTITVRDLTMDELVKLEISNNDGSWEGKRHPLSSRLISRMEGERLRRLKRDMARLAPAAIDALEDLVESAEQESVRFQVSKHILEHNIGKVPEVVHIGAETEYDRLTQTGFVILRGAENVSVDSDDDDIVDAEVIEEGQEAVS